MSTKPKDLESIVPVTNFGSQVPLYQGPIPLTVPAIRQDGRTFAGGNYVFPRRTAALHSGDAGMIEQWGTTYFDLADACITGADGQYAIQPDSGFLTGIQGVVETGEGTYVAIDANAVKSALKEGGMDYFQAVDVTAQFLYRGEPMEHKVENVVLLPYDIASIKLNREQASAVAVNWFERDVVDRDLTRSEIMQSRWQIYPEQIVNELADAVFPYNKDKHGYNSNMGIWLPSAPEQGAELRAFYLSRLSGRSGLNGRLSLGDDGNRLLGVVE